MKIKIVVVLLICCLALSVFAGGKQEPKKEPVLEVEEKAEPVTTAKYREAPMLTELVKAGKLPTVEERLPDSPLVFKPQEEIGEYGGTVNSILWGQPSEGPPVLMNASSLTLLDSDDLLTVTPGLVERWEYTNNYKTLTLYFRKGTKWSDGQPFTVDDILFWY
jgi:peptide/nickel transport system substrate-binding protein